MITYIDQNTNTPIEGWFEYLSIPHKGDKVVIDSTEYTVTEVIHHQHQITILVE